MRHTTTYLFYTLWFTLALASCKNDQAPTATATKEIKKVSIPAFSADSAYAHIESQLAFGYRVPGTDAHKACGAWLASKLESYGGMVKTQNFKAKFNNQTAVPSFNIIAQFNQSASQRILLGAHWDSRAVADKDDERQTEPIAGADDGASGVAVLLEIARLISEYPIDLGIDIVLFDAEDQGDNSNNTSWAQGAQYWSSNLIPSNYKAEYGILLDMVGAEGAVFGKEEFSYQNARPIVDKIWTLAQRMGYSDFFRDETTGSVMDDHYWVMKNAKFPMIDIIHQSAEDRSSFGAYHHTHDDNIEIISKRTLRVVGQVVTAVLYNEAMGVL